MRLKTFRGETITDALREVKKEFGPDAIIISTLESGNEVSITAALERRDEENVHDEEESTTLGLLDTLCHILEHHRVPDPIREDIITSISSLPNDVVKKGFEAAIDSTFSFKSIVNPNSKFLPPNRLALLGPAGAGKSVSIAKLASEYVIAGFEPFVITLDCLKAGAITQLEVYMKAMGLPLHPAENINQFKKVLNESPVNTYILVDTPGVNPYHKDEIQFLEEVVQCLEGEVVLTFPSGIDSFEISDHLSFYKALNVKRVILTRADTTSRYGALITALFEGSFSLAQVSAGPEVGSRLKAGSPALLAELLKKFYAVKSEPHHSQTEAVKELRR